MPIYEYKCQKCGKQFEAFQGITDPEVKNCKFCNGRVQKLMSLSSFSLKGTGWYATDYKNKGQSCAAREKNSDKNESSSTASCCSASCKTDQNT